MICRISFARFFIVFLISNSGSYLSFALDSTNCLSKDSYVIATDISYVHSVDVSGVNSSKVNYTLTFSWQNEDSILGLLIKFEDKDKQSRTRMNIPFRWLLGFKSLGASFESKYSNQTYCSKEDGKHFLLTIAGKDEECTIPCDRLSTNTSSMLCCLLEKEYEVYSKKTTSITKEATFGKSYMLHLVRYSNDTIYSQEIQTQQLFCRDELISRHNMTLNESNVICSEKQMISASVFSAGPPSNVVLYNISVNLLTNRGEVIYRFQDPYDISEKVQVTNFLITLKRGRTKRSRTIKKDSEVEGFYYFTDSNILLGALFNITIEPRFNCTDGINVYCSGIGRNYTHAFLIPDINACNETDTSTPYCDWLATCQDNPPTHSSPATCECPAGYMGNGVSMNLTDGQGCSKISYCDELCHHLAICTDDLNVANDSRCTCPDSYYGDGLKKGSGCTHIALPLGISFGILICIICTSLATIKCLHARSKRLKNMELFYSKYLDDGEYGDESLQNGVISGFLGKNMEISSDDIDLQEIIGRGSFGVVRKATLTTPSEIKLVAVKCIPDAVDTAGKESFMAEIAQMSTVGSHPNVITMIGLCSNADCSLGIVVEYMKYGDLQNFLWNARKIESRQFDPIYNLTQSDVCGIAIQCANGLKYLREIKIIHGDVAARNVLVTEGLRCKLSDFGLSTDVYCVGRIIKAKERKLPLKWVSPERMMEGTSCITWRSDIWSFGILLYEIVTFGAPPYPDVPNNQIFNMLEQGKRMDRPEACSKELYNLMLQCWQWEPMRRPSPQSLKNEIQRYQSRVAYARGRRNQQLQENDRPTWN